jgi:hypothetical protein
MCPAAVYDNAASNAPGDSVHQGFSVLTDECDVPNANNSFLAFGLFLNNQGFVLDLGCTQVLTTIAMKNVDDAALWGW